MTKISEIINPELLNQAELTLKTALQSSKVKSLKADVQNLPKKYSGYGFTGMIKTPEDGRFIDFGMKFSKEPLEKNSIFMYGQPGNGKTRLAVAICRNFRPTVPNYLVESLKGKPRQSKILYIRMDMMFDRMNMATSNQGKEKAIKDLIQQYDMFLFDDLSFENFSPAKAENLFLLIDTMLVEEVGLIITSNSSLETFQSKEPRALDRLREMSYLMEFTGKSFRK